MELMLEETERQAGGLSLALRQLLRQNLMKLPLERFCEKGGWPMHPRIERLDWSEQASGTAGIHLLISFVETGAACCSGACFENNRLAEFSLAYDRQSGRITLIG
jgi:hypothetical protein